MGFADVLAVRVSVSGNFADNLFCHFGVYRAAFGQACVVGVVLVLLLQTAAQQQFEVALIFVHHGLIEVVSAAGKADKLHVAGSGLHKLAQLLLHLLCCEVEAHQGKECLAIEIARNVLIVVEHGFLYVYRLKAVLDVGAVLRLYYSGDEVFEETSYYGSQHDVFAYFFHILSLLLLSLSCSAAFMLRISPSYLARFTALPLKSRR